MRLQEITEKDDDEYTTKLKILTPFLTLTPTNVDNLVLQPLGTSHCRLGCHLTGHPARTTEIKCKFLSPGTFS
jgi:hypothetical protein